MMQAPDVRPSSRWRWVPVLILCIGIGIAAGLLVSWGLWPVRYVDVAPSSLHPVYREEYILLVSQAYAYDRNADVAQARLGALGDQHRVGAQIATLAEEYAAQGRSQEHIEALAGMAYALGVQRAALAPYLPVVLPAATWTPRPTPTPPSTPTPTMTVPPTRTPLPTRTATPTRTSTRTATPTPAAHETASSASATSTATPAPSSGPRYVILWQERTCVGKEGLLEVEVYDAQGEQQPNVELLARWDTREERFYTGLKPDHGAGYADLALEKGHTYQLSIVGFDSEVAQNITADTCLEGGHLASWQVAYRLDDSGSR